jgi:CBS domain-containing protein
MMTVFEVLDEMGEAGIRRFPIVDEDGTLEGIVTLDDLLVLLGKEIQSATEIIQSQLSHL